MSRRTRPRWSAVACCQSSGRPTRCGVEIGGAVAVAPASPSSGTRKPKSSASGKRTRDKPVWQDQGLRVFAPKGNRLFFRLLGRLDDGTPIDTTGGTDQEAAIAA